MTANHAFASVALILFTVIIGCDGSREQYDELVRVGTEIAAVQHDLHPPITELGKIAIQIEDLAKLRNPAVKPLAADIAAAQQLVAEAFVAAEKAQDAAVVGLPEGMTHREYIAAQEAFRDLLRQALERTRTALAKSHEVIQAYSAKSSNSSARSQ